MSHKHVHNYLFLKLYFKKYIKKQPLEIDLKTMLEVLCIKPRD